ncbi:MAG: NAD(P)-dependent oxidoreductase [Lachnospiraceae bacterium]|nr:NAD(P)-dependent oxidoreductase [Lachnospiraceae bacterium]
MRDKLRVFVTGATGGMGFESLKQMMEDKDLYDITVLARDSEKNHKLLGDYKNCSNLRIYWGDLLNEEDVYNCVQDADIVLHIAAFVSPQADYYPDKAMKNNLGSTVNIINAIKKCGRQDEVRFVYIGTVAETGDRMPPIHWGRVGDPIKPSMFDYYAVSKVAAERAVIESGLKYWVSLRQTGIIGPAMSKIRDGIMFHNCFDNVLEYVSDRDSGRAMRNLCKYTAEHTLDDSFWGHIYNIGGGESCRASCYDLYKNMYGKMGLTKMEYILEPKAQATRNFHGQYYLDSDKLEDYLHFRQDSMEYCYDSFIKELGSTAGVAKFITKLPGGQKIMGTAMKNMFDKLAYTEHGTKRFIKENMEDHIEAYWGSRKAWEEIPESIKDMKHFTDWDEVILLDHGYDENKPESQLDIADMSGAAEFRGGKLLSENMTTGDWKSKLKFQCAFGHEFEASPRLVLEGGHWCPECERKSWNYGKRAQVDPFFAQVWNPLHEADELREYPKVVSDLDV